MSKISITPNASGTGVFTISSPATSTDRTLTLPDADGTVLTSASSLASANLTGALPAISGAALTNLPAGGVLQVVSTFSSTGVINNTSTYTDTGLTIVITLSSTSNKVLIQATVPWLLGTNGGSGQMQFRITRDGTALTSNLVFNNVSAIVQLGGTQMISWVDSPATTSAVTYKVQFRELSMSGRYGNTTVMPTLNAAQNGMMQALEIAG